MIFERLKVTLEMGGCMIREIVRSSVEKDCLWFTIFGKLGR